MSNLFLAKVSGNLPGAFFARVLRAAPIGMALCLLLPALLFSQAKPPMKWGEVPRADLEMKKFPDDSNAAAVILGDFGEIYFDGFFEMVFTRHRRIKILSEAGYKWASSTVKIGEQEHLLEATDPLRPCGMLPVAALTDLGWLVEKKAPRWIQIANRESFNTQTTVSAKLAADGTITGWYQTSAGGYAALLERRTLRDKKEEEYLRDGALKSLMDAKLDSFRISHKDSIYAPLLTRVFFSTADHAQAAPGDNIYFNPILLDRREENPFKQPERTFPVDFAYATKQTYTLNLTLPEGYVAAELPQNVLLNLPNEGGQFRRLAQVNESHLQLMSQLVIRQPRFAPEEYKALREFYDRIVAAHAEVIVLKRDAAGAAKKQ
jgi:hypothetical protein